MSAVYGVCNKELVHYDVSNTERGAKQYATRHGYDIVSVRFNSGYIVDIIARKVNGKWVNTTKSV